jgi:hypothetical protein
MLAMMVPARKPRAAGEPDEPPATDETSAA